MKNIIYILLLAAFCSCSDFLEESSQDEIRPSTVNDLEQLMLGEGYPRESYFQGYLDLMTDDVECHYTEESTQAKCLKAGTSPFIWEDDMYDQFINNQEKHVDTWEHYYRRIKGCNVVLSMLDQVSGSYDAKMNLKGQALAMRAYYHFMLVNLYGQPYNAEGVDIKTSPGVPLMLKSEVYDTYPPRTSVLGVYEQVEKDLLEATPLLEQYGTNNIAYKATDLFAHTLLARMYLYMEKWDKAKEHANYVLKKKPVLLKLCDQFMFDENGMQMPNLAFNVYELNSPELIWGYSSLSEYSSFFQEVIIFGSSGKWTKPAFQVSDDLNDLYEYNATDLNRRKDCRVEFFYSGYMVSYSFIPDPPYIAYISRIQSGRKNKAVSNVNVNKGMRVSELYLIRAECNIREYMENGNSEACKAALEDLNYIRERRYDTRNEAYVPVEIKDPQKLFKFCQDERRRELSFEDHRWFDLRRYGMPEIKHIYPINQQETKEYILPAKGKRYVLPISRVVLEKNPALVPNP